MKKLVLTILTALFVLPVASALSQAQTARGITRASGAAEQAAREAETRFDLDFPGGTPGELIDAIERASAEPVNAVIPEEYSKMRLPPLKMNGVTVPQLFEALQHASVRRVTYRTGVGPGVPGRQTGFQTAHTSYGFERRAASPVWYFHVSSPPEEPPLPDFVHYYQLGSFLAEYKVEDITTAIQTGWKMRGSEGRLELKFHPETNLLIAVGQAENLRLIDHVLEQLRTPGRGNRGPPAPGPDPAEKNRQSSEL